MSAERQTCFAQGREFIRVDSQRLIVDERGYFDLVSFLTQIGAMPQPAH